MKFNSYCEGTKIWSGPNNTPLYNKNISIGQVILQCLQNNPTKIGQISDNNNVKCTNKEILLKSIRVAENLQKYGLKEGDIIGIIAKNSSNLAPIIFGALCIGTPVNTLDPTFNQKEIAHMFNITKPKLVFCDYENLIDVHVALNSIHLKCDIFIFESILNNRRIPEIDVKFITDVFLVETETENDFIAPELRDTINSPAIIICSSGTTGLPKGVCLSHAAVLERTNNVSSLTSDGTIFCFSSLYWLSGISILIAATIYGMTRIITTSQFSPDLLLHIVENHHVTHLVTPPSQLALILQCPAVKLANLSELKYYICGGSAVSSKLCTNMEMYLPNGLVYVTYGLSELAGLATMNYNPPRKGSIGTCSNNISIKIINENDELCGVNEVGEILCLTKYPFVGYFGNSVATADARCADGFLKTGDIGYFDSDGYLFMVDRKKDILKYMLYHVSPTELESIILGLNGVQNVCVVGIDDDVAGDLPAAVIIKSNDDINETHIYDYVTELASNSHQLRGGVYFVETFPMTASGKIKRREVKQIASELFLHNSKNEKARELQ